MNVRSCWVLAGALVAPTVFAAGIAATVGISGFDYTPGSVQITPGQTVDFAATGLHPLKLDDDDTITCTQDCNVTFLAVGDYGFYCENHGSAGGNGMAGAVQVTGDPASAPVFVGTFEHTVLVPLPVA